MRAQKLLGRPPQVGPIPVHLVIALTIVAMTGCRSFATPQATTSQPVIPASDGQPATTVQQVAGEEPASPAVAQTQYDAPGEQADPDSPIASTKSFFGLFGPTDQGTQDARLLYQQADQKFRQASSQPVGEREKLFAEAAKSFENSAKASPDSAIEQDALFMQGESLFFANEFNDAAKAWADLQEKHPRNRHNDQVASRLFSISRYWAETAQADADRWFGINLTDSTLPFFSPGSRAVRLFDKIRFDDPTGRLADDATMAAAAEYIRQKKFSEADEFLTDIRETFEDSDHLFLAHMLGVRTKLQIYAGPKYSNLYLEEAKKLIAQTRRRFPNKMREQKYADELAKASAEIAFHEAERLAFRARYRETRKEYGAAKVMYRKLLEDHGQTPHAEVARQRLAAIDTLPEIPTRRLAFLKKLFPDHRSKNPLELSTGDGEQSGNTETLLR